MSLDSLLFGEATVGTKDIGVASQEEDGQAIPGMGLCGWREEEAAVGLYVLTICEQHLNCRPTNFDQSENRGCDARKSRSGCF